MPSYTLSHGFRKCIWKLQKMKNMKCVGIWRDWGFHIHFLVFSYTLLVPSYTLCDDFVYKLKKNIFFAEECKTKPKPLQPGQTVYFVVQPRFMNVDIRIIVDVTQGALDLLMSTQDDSFVVFTNKTNGFHDIYLDNNYRWAVTEDETELLQPISLSPMLNKYRNMSEDERLYFNPSQECKTKTDGFTVRDFAAAELSTYITLNECNTLLRVFGLKNRLVLTLPQAIHSLQVTRFFITLRASPSSNSASYGLIFFRQDQLHIDLFVFFSVFFSCFFLFLAICVVAWKAKQAADMRQARRRHNIELIHMAQRPFARINLQVGPEPNTPSHRRRRTRQHANLVAQEQTSDGVAAVGTVLVSLPGSKAPVRMALGSSLINFSRHHYKRQRPGAGPSHQQGW